MINWRPITAFEPDGNGTVMLFCSATSWVRLANADAVVGLAPDEIEPATNYRYTHFAYIDHPDSIPPHHPFHELIVLKDASEAEHAMLAKTIGDRADSYAEFSRDEKSRYYSGQVDAHLSWMCENHYSFIFKTREERLLGEIALAGKRA